MAVLTVVLLVLTCAVSGLLTRVLFTTTAAVATLFAAFLAVANLPGGESAARPADSSAPAADRSCRKRGRDASGRDGIAAAEPKGKAKAVETSVVGTGPDPGPQPWGTDPRTPAPDVAPAPVRSPATQGVVPLPARFAPAVPVAVGETPTGGPPAAPGQVEPYTPAEGLGRPDADRAEQPGRFPVLRKASPAAMAPWLLPEAPSAAAITADEAVIGGLQLRAASVSGPSHRSRGIPRQDAYRIGRDRAGQYLVVAVADGMSDSTHSDIGAGAAVIALVNTLRELLDRGTPLEQINVREVFLSAARQMYGAAKQRGWTADEVRAVALAAVIPVRPGQDGVRNCWLGAIGDVSAWRLVGDSWERLIGKEKGGLDPSAITHFLPHHVDHLDYGTVQLAPGAVMSLTTDGVADAFALGADARQWFAERWRQPPSVGAFLLDVGFEQAQLQDDRTAVVVWCADTVRTAAGGRQR
ncbi:protein phosphatase 2C domain-containing protein [Streptomyces sp. NPDC008150]|uniref:protein phosphatase 2C domain-containing protein n=1 Tax=Streptomyces sp. NPDC008150 TaxID=3364816 RepID=UPI0036EE41F8